MYSPWVSKSGPASLMSMIAVFGFGWSSLMAGPATNTPERIREHFKKNNRFTLQLPGERHERLFPLFDADISIADKLFCIVTAPVDLQRNAACIRVPFLVVSEL